MLFRSRDDRDLLALLRGQFGTAALVVEFDRFLALLDHLLKHAEQVGIAQRRLALPARLDIGAEAFVRQQNAIMARPDSRPMLATIACPTLVLTGDEDSIIPNSLSVEMADGIHGAKLTIIPHCGHLPQPEQPQATADALAGWLQS